MGQKSSVVKVKSEMSVTCGCGTVDGVRLSYGSRSCCGPKRRQIASFTFPRNKWQQLSPEAMLRNSSAEVAAVNVGRLREKDGHTPVRVKVLAGKVSVFRTEMSLADLLARLKYTERGGKAVLSFSLAGTGAQEHAFTVMFCNGKRLVNGGTVHHTVTREHGVLQNQNPQQKQVMDGEKPSLDVQCQTEKDDVMLVPHPSLDDQCLTQAQQCPSLEEGVMGDEAPSLDMGWVTEEEEVDDPSLTMEWVHEEPQEQKVRHRGKRSHKRSHRTPATRTTDDNIPRGGGPVPRTLWDRVADCAGLVALGLVLYHAWVEFNAWW